MNLFKTFSFVGILCTSFYAHCVFLMPHIPAEVGFGIGGFESFNCTWQPLFELLDLPELNQDYDINDIPSARYASADLRNCHGKGVVQVADYPHRKKITVVHEVMNYSLGTIRDSDYLIYMNDWQRQIVENIAGIKKPCLVLPCHPIPFNLTAHINIPRKNSVYIGGHFFGCKSQGLVERLEALVDRLDSDPETQETTITCYFIVAFDYLVDAFNTFERNIRLHPLLKDRVEIIHNADHIPYMTMFENMASCKYTYLWRNEASCGELKQMIDARDPSVLQFPVGESSMLANAVAAGCIPIVEDNYRFRAHFEGLTFSYEEFAEQLRDFIIKIDNESRS